MAIQPPPPVSQGFLTVEASRSHSDTPHSVGLLWTSDQADTDTSLTNTKHSKETDIHALEGIRTRNPTRREDTDPRLRPRGTYDNMQIK
jgi:hypothetical protein